ncbi:dual OB domain-containing protein [Acinetobacter parvus]
MDRTIVIFASSIKYQGRCVAGKCISSNNWIRPVSTKSLLKSKQVFIW